jgi:cysteinyl-tRNA synthetase
MKLYNSLTKQIQDFEPAHQQISIYTCGPTVYERAHIGNLASFIYVDTLKRTLKLAFPDHSIKHVMNITDVDDKTIAASREKYPELDTLEALQKLTREYEGLFKQDLSELGISAEEITFVRATENIEPMQKLIKELLDAGFAYAAEDGIYFSIENYKHADKKYGQLVEITAQSTGQARVKNDEYDKDNIHDFVLWKAQKEDEPAWDFEINGQNIKGRPGWHVECSAMSVKELGQPFDIHTGGVDLKFPHHENEIAQSTANDGDLLARLFFHSEHLLVDNKKMSKSLNNFYTLEDIKNKGFDPLAFRLLVLQSHYQNQAHFSWDNLEAAQNRLRDLQQVADLQWQLVPEGSDIYPHAIMSHKSGFNKYLEENLNTPAALTVISGLERAITASGISEASLQPFKALLLWFDDSFGLALSNRPDVQADQKILITEREQARKNQDWQKADELRTELEEQGIELNDTPHGPRWSRA